MNVNSTRRSQPAFTLAICLVTGLVSTSATQGQQAKLLPQRADVLPLPDDTALICEAGGLIDGGGVAKNVRQNATSPNRTTQRQVLNEFVAKIDVNRDSQLDHQELLTLDFLTREQLLDKFDENLDRKLSTSEIEQALPPIDNHRAGYPNSDQPPSDMAKQPEGFRNLRRFGIGLEPPKQPQRSSPFARAATFGTTPGFTPPRKKSSIGPQQGGGRCQLSTTNSSSDFYLRVRRSR